MFITIPTVFSSMPFGNFFMVLFFVLVSIAATGAMLSLLEVSVIYAVEEFRWSRRKATLATITAIALVGSTATLSSSVLSDFLVFGKNLFDLYDFATSNIMLHLGGIFIALYVGWKWGFAKAKVEVSNNGILSNNGLTRVYVYLVKYFAPVAITIVLLTGLGILKF